MCNNVYFSCPICLFHAVLSRWSCNSYFPGCPDTCLSLLFHGFPVIGWPLSFTALPVTLLFLSVNTVTAIVGALLTGLSCDSCPIILSLYYILEILEKMVAIKLTNYLQLNKLLYAHQYGFQRGFSTEQILFM